MLVAATGEVSDVQLEYLPASDLRLTRTELPYQARARNPLARRWPAPSEDDALYPFSGEG